VTYNVVCISRDVGAGGEEIGRAVAERLGFRYVDEEIIQLAAKSAGIHPETVAGTEERHGLVKRLLDSLAQSSIVMPEAMAFAPELMTTPQPEGIRELIREAVRQTAAGGRAVIVAHAASYVLSGQEGVLRVLVTGSPDVCAGRLAARAGGDDAAAKRLVSQGRAARADYLQRFHEVGQELPTHYDLVINTDQLEVDAAVGAVIAVAG